MKFLLNDLNLSQKQDLLTQIFDQEVPLTFSDVVVVYVNSVGNEEGGLLQRSFVKKIYAGTVGGRPLSALQLSTAAGVVAVHRAVCTWSFAGRFRETGIDRSRPIF